VSASTDPLDVFRDFMGAPNVLERRWNDLREEMEKAGIRNPELAITELQLFAHPAPPKDGEEAKLTYDRLTDPATHAEALYDLLIYHAAIRLAPFVPMVTHSATVNHGGGLKKQRERVYANPCHYAQSAFADFAEATPVAIRLRAATAKMPVVLGDLRNAKEGGEYPVVDALAAVAKNGDMLLSIVHRETTGPLRLSVSLEGFSAAPEAKTLSFTAPFPWSANTLNQPDAVRPIPSVTSVKENRLSLELPPWSAMILRIPSR
jgi:alpha-N-arabinofuranosidase